MAARNVCIQESRPVLIEAMTYRIGHHSTSDDSSAYRSVDEVRNWDQKDHPISRLRKYMERKEWWSEEEEKSWKDEAKRKVMTAFMEVRLAFLKELFPIIDSHSFQAEKLPKPNYLELFNDVYDELPPILLQQSNDLIEHLKMYPKNYPLNNYKQDL